MSSPRVLFATRAFESPNTEGGYLLLKDLALEASQKDDRVVGAFFSTGNYHQHLELIPGFVPGWGRRQALRFIMGLWRHQHRYHIVHTAHVPTGANTKVLNWLSNRGRMRGTRYVQTITGMPKSEGLARSLFWGDAVVCLNEQASETVRRFHSNVHTIAPLPNVRRLTSEKHIPQELSDKWKSHRLVALPIVFQRLDPRFPLDELCSRLLEQSNVMLAIPCRFGEDTTARQRLVGTLEQFADRVTVLGEIDWFIDLLRHSSLCIYPITDMAKKFNPPLVLTEAAALNIKVLTSDKVTLEGCIEEGRREVVSDDTVQSWHQAAMKMLADTVAPDDVRRDAYRVRVFESYVEIYDALCGEVSS